MNNRWYKLPIFYYRIWPDQAESRLRPLARLERITALPPRVAMRARKPWVRLRRKLLGWKVCFILNYRWSPQHFVSDETLNIQLKFSSLIMAGKCPRVNDYTWPSDAILLWITHTKSNRLFFVVVKRLIWSTAITTADKSQPWRTRGVNHAGSQSR